MEMIAGFVRERHIRKVLRGIARQRVATVLQPGNVWVVERAFKRTSEIDAALATCMMRGWVEPLAENVPTGDLNESGELDRPNPFARVETQYRLTDGGWAALNRAHAWAVVGALAGIISIFLAYLQVCGSKA